MTQGGYDRLKEELTWRVEVKKRYLTEELDLARQAGDERENDAFSLAFEDFKINEDEIFRIKDVLSNCEIVKIKSSDSVEIGTTVVLQKENGEIVNYTIVTEYEVNSGMENISDQSPLGMSLLGCKVDDIVEVDTPKGNIIYTVKDII